MYHKFVFTVDILYLILPLVAAANVGDVGIEPDTSIRPISNVDFRVLKSKCPSKKIPDDYEYTSGIGAHKLYKIGETFNNARKRCNMEGGHLAIINSLAEEMKLADMFRRVKENELINATSIREARLGVHDLFEKFDWVTILGVSLYTTGYSKWGITADGTQQPDNAEGAEDCANLLIYSINNGMNDVRCDKPYAFFCEIDV